MPKFTELDKDIEAAEARIAKLEGELQQEKSYLRGLRQAQARILGAPSLTSSGRPRATGQATRRPLQSGRIKDAWEYLQKNGPAHVDVILKSIGLKVTPETRQNLASQLIKGSKRGWVRRVGKNVFEALPQ